MTTKPDAIQPLLTTLFYRQSCPAADALGDYHLGILPPGQRLAVAQHLRLCPHCAAEFSLYAADETADETAGGGLVSQLQGVVNRVRWAVAASAPAAAPVRRAGVAGVRKIYRSNEIEAMVTVRPAPTGYQRWGLMGRLTPADAADTTELWTDDSSRLLDTQPVDEGYFDFSQLRAGDYFLCLKADGEETWLGPLTIEGQPE